MCGIAGCIDASLSPDARIAALRGMCAAMRHRGPDDSGWETRHEATIGGCRLAIFDPANGHQPMISPDGRWTLVFNGAIYNFAELRQELSAGGWPFRTNCDTEVLLAAIARWGTGCLPRLRGMFAFAAWDDVERRLLLARDPFGIKPLYVHQRGERLVFASELNALFASGLLAAEIDRAAVADYLAWLAVPAPRTIYRGVVSLRPGEYAFFQHGKLQQQPSWSFRGIPAGAPCADYAEFVAELRQRLDDTIRAHVLADVPVGAFLSGGLDSAVVVGLMTRASGTPLRTFCVGFDHPEYSETSDAEATARHFGAVHQTHRLTGSEVANDLDRLLAALDQPTGDGVNTYYASQLARAGGVTVALSGLGGDEVFGGYPTFHDTPRLGRFLPWWRRLPPPARRTVVRRLRRGDTRRRKLADVLEYATGLQEIASLQRRVFSEEARAALLTREARGIIDREGPFHPQLAELSRDLETADPYEVVAAWELRTYMTDVLLRDSDVMSMRHSLELRVPLVDRPFIEWLWRQPAKADGRQSKSALYDATADLLPPGLRERRKQGFTLPFPHWMKQELRPFLADTFSDASLRRSGLFEPKAVQALWNGFLAGSDSREWSRVWSLAILVAFLNRRGAPVAAEPPAVPRLITGTSHVSRRRVLLMAPEIFASEGGIPRILQTYLSATTDLLGEHGRTRVVALNDTPSDSARALARLPRTVERVEGCARRKTRFIQRTLELARGCDVAICGHVRQLPIAWLAQKLNPRLRYFLVAHGIEVWRDFGPAERTALRGAERILCVSDFTRRELLKHLPLPQEKAVVLHNALDPVFHIKGGRPLRECPPVILTVTRITQADQYKGLPYLIQAMPAIRGAIPAARLRLVGRGDDVPRLQRMAAEHGVADAVDFTGYLDDDQLEQEMQSCRLFALPSRKEGFGLVFLEAMAHGRPCLGARAGGVPEVINDTSGVLVEYGDVAGIARAAIDALTREWDENEILDRARQFSFEGFRSKLAAVIGE